MGNISSMARASTALDSYVAELGNDISYDKSLSSSRFLKTILARHAYGPIVLKIFIKPDPAMSLRVIQRRLKTERDNLSDLPNVNTYQAFVETDKAGYLIRQWVGSNLYDRVSTQPYLASIEKKWIAFQLLTCLKDARLRKASQPVAHGDVKSENILLTTDLTLLLTDFSSSFKPTYLPLDDPSDFSFFFDTSSRRTCYIAPERFYTSDSKLAEEKRKVPGEGEFEGWGKRDGRVTEEMDVFSAGCVLAEMWTDGRTVFNLSELFAYRQGTVGLEGLLENIDDDEVKEMISQMLSRDPASRPSFDRILSNFREIIFPEYFYTFLQDYIASLSETAESQSNTNSEITFLQRSAGLCGIKIDRLLDEWESISVHLDKGPSPDGPALLLLNIVTSSIRNCIWPSSRLHGLQLFLNLLPYLFDEDKVDRIIPFVVELLSDDVPIVRAEACRTLVIVVESVNSITPQNSTFIPEYLLPQMRHLAVDIDIFVRATYAKGLVRLADAAVNMLEMSQATKPIGGPSSESSTIIEPDYDAMLQEIQSVVEEQATTLLVDTAPPVKRSILASISDLCLFFGRQKSNETVLSHIMTYLNDRDWQLRLAFFDGIVGVGAFIGVRAIEEYVLPLMLQALADPEEAVVARVIGSMTSLTSLGLLARMKSWDVFAAVRGFLCHPNMWIRQGTAGFIAAAARNLPPTDVWCILYPGIRPLLHADIKEMNEISILSAILPPLPRSTLIAAKVAALQTPPKGYWNIPQSKGTTKSSLVKAAQGQVTASQQLRDKGITEKDERKIEVMKEFIVKQANASKARESSELSSSEANLVTGKSVSLTDLGVTPQTIFISPRTIGVDAKADIKRLRPHLSDSPISRRTSFASRSNRGTVDNPLDEIRKKLATLEPLTIAKTDKTPAEPLLTSNTESNATPSESGLSSSIDLAALSRSSRKKIDSKAAPAVAASHTNATGTTTIHDEPLSGRTTPLATGGFAPATPRSLAPYSSSYEGQDPGVRAFLEQVDLDNYREPLLDFGPRVTASHRKRNPRVKNTSSIPQGVTMIAHLTQHEGAITAIVTSPDSLFFATASEDASIHIWDSARLERSVTTKPRLTYRMDARVASMCRIENTHCLAAAAEDGQLHVLRVHVGSSGGSTKYGKVECIRSWTASEQEGYVKLVAHLQDSSLFLVTSTSMIAILDIRNMEITKRFQHALELGVVTALCPSAHWLVIGTSTGTLSLWDLRFGLLLKSWKAGGEVTSLKLHPSKGKGRWIMASVMPPSSNGSPKTALGSENEDNSGPLVEAYDIETSKLMEIYEVRTSRPSKHPDPPKEVEDVISDKAAYISQLAQSAESVLGSLTKTITAEDFSNSSSPLATPKSVLDLIVGQSWSSLPKTDESVLMSVPELGTKNDHSRSGNPGWMVTAGEDRVVRYWDLVKVQDGFVVCGSQKEKDVSFKQMNGSGPTHIYTLPNVHRHPNVPTRERERQPLRPHYDAICKLGTVETPFSSCIISGDRSGVVKVWRMEGGPVSNR
nr:VPS15 protein kinase [Kwoniella mangroviensis CBS 8507]OCF66138.1 VPS15 protein kinase [Kwoniella mangroviensis CBS 8507]